MNGFGNAPISKALLIGTLGASIISQTKKATPIPLAVFKTPGELIAGCFLIFIFRVLERQSGSAKFGGFIFITTGISAALQYSLFKLISLGSANNQPSGLNAPGFVCGPYGILFASLAQYYFQIPPSRKFYLLGCKLSDKVFVYFAAAHLLFSHGAASVLAAASGLLSGLVYRRNFLGVKKFRLPTIISRFFAGTFGLLLEDSRSTRVVHAPGELNRTPHSQAPRQGTAREPTPSRNPGYVLPAANPEVLEQLVGMGFDRERAAHALQVTVPPNDIDQAISMLVS